MNPISEIRRLRRKYTDQLLTLLALFIALEMFVFSPLQAMGIFAFQGFVIATLLAIMAGMLIISDHPAAFAVMSICLAANVVVLLLRVFYPPWHYNIYILAVAWFAIAITLGAVVAAASPTG